MKNFALDPYTSDLSEPFPQDGTLASDALVRSIGTGAIAGEMAVAFREEKLGLPDDVPGVPDAQGAGGPGAIAVRPSK
jgi:hypothetical protein